MIITKILIFSSKIESYQQHFFFFFFSSCVLAYNFTLFEEGATAWVTVCYFLPLTSSLLFFPPAVTKAKSLKNSLIFCPDFADTSVKLIPSFLNSSAATLFWTALYYYKSFLLPIIKINASSPLTSLTLSIHFDKLW